jgi:hypothetical protein
MCIHSEKTFEIERILIFQNLNNLQRLDIREKNFEEPLELLNKLRQKGIQMLSVL